MLLLEVSVVISSRIKSLWVSVYKRAIACLHHGHKPFTWWYGTLVANTVYQESHCHYITIMPDLWKGAQEHVRYLPLPTPWMDKRTTVRLLGYAPNHANVACCLHMREFRATPCTTLLHLLVVAEPHRIYVASSHVGRCRCENALLAIRLQILRNTLINGCKMHCATLDMILIFKTFLQIQYCADTGPE